LKLTECEANQFIEFMNIWFHKNGGNVQRNIKLVKITHDQDESLFFKPKDFENHTPKEFEDKA